MSKSPFAIEIQEAVKVMRRKEALLKSFDNRNYFLKSLIKWHLEAYTIERNEIEEI